MHVSCVRSMFSNVKCLFTKRFGTRAQLPPVRSVIYVVGAGKPFRLVKLGLSLGACVLVERARILNPST